MFRPPSNTNSFLLRDKRRQADKTYDQYNRLEELESEFSLIRKEIHDDSEQYRLRQLSTQTGDAPAKTLNSHQLQEVSDRLKSLTIPMNQPMKGKFVKPDRSERKSHSINKNSVIPRVNRIAELSSELRTLSEKVLAKDNTDVSISNMSGGTELTVPSCASWDVPYGSFHCVIMHVGNESPSLSKSTETSEEDSQESETQNRQVLLVRSCNESEGSSDTEQDKATLGTSSTRAQQLMKENSLMWNSSYIDAPIFKQVSANVENYTNSNEVAKPPNPEPSGGDVPVFRRSINEGICLSECQSASGNPLTILATPTIVQSVEGPTQVLEVLQLHCFPMTESCDPQGDGPTPSLEDESQHSSRGKESVVTNQQSPAVNLSKPPRHPLTKPVAKDTTDHRETIMAGFCERTVTPKKVKKASKKPPKVTVAEIEALLNRENEENPRDNNQVRFQSIPSVQGNPATPQKSKHRRVHSYDTAKISNVTATMEGPRETSSQRFPNFQNSHEIFRGRPTSLVDSTGKPNQHPKRGSSIPSKREELSERRSERSTRRSRDRRKRRSRSSSSSRSSRSWTDSDERKDKTVPMETTRMTDKERSGRSTSSDSHDSLSSRSNDHSLERVNKSTCTDICGIMQNVGDALASNSEDVDMALREIRKRQIDRVIAERVGVVPLKMSMAEERLFQRIRDRSRRYDHDDEGSSSPNEVDKALDVNSYRSRRHGVSKVNTLKLKQDVTPTRRMEQKDLDHVGRRRFLEDFRKEISSMEQREKRRRSASRSMERRRGESKSHHGEETCSDTTPRSLSPLSRRPSNNDS